MQPVGLLLGPRLHSRTPALVFRAPALGQRRAEMVGCSSVHFLPPTRAWTNKFWTEGEEFPWW